MDLLSGDQAAELEYFPMLVNGRKGLVAANSAFDSLLKFAAMFHVTRIAAIRRMGIPIQTKVYFLIFCFLNTSASVIVAGSSFSNTTFLNSASGN